MKILQPKYFLYSPYFLAFIISIIIILFLPDLFSKYKIEVITKGKTVNDNEIISYDDLDFDGNSERICTFSNTQKHFCFQVFDYQGGVIDQWNLNGIIPKIGKHFIASDYNEDGIKEIFTFCQSGDSIFLYAFEPIPKGQYFIKHRFISVIDKVNGITDYKIGEMNVINLDTTQRKSLVFIIAGGFSLQPRKIFIYDIFEDTLISSTESGSIITNLIFTDLKYNGSFEIAGNANASGNYSDTANIPFGDNSAWLMVFDKNLDYLFDPIEFPGFHTVVQPVPFKLLFAINIQVFKAREFSGFFYKNVAFK